MRKKIPEYEEYFKSSLPEIKVEGTLNYRHGHVYHMEYDSKKLPSDQVLKMDLKKILEAYETLFLRGGRDSDYFSIIDQDVTDKKFTIEETYKKKVHAHIERPSNAKIKQLKKKLGYVCQCCDFDFEKTYGSWGKEFAEVHHVKPLAELKGEEQTTDPKTDLAILCANCHRMVHRKKGMTLSVAELKRKMNE